MFCFSVTVNTGNTGFKSEKISLSVLEDINKEGFVPKAFVSNRSDKIKEKMVQSQAEVSVSDSSVFHTSVKAKYL